MIYILSWTTKKPQKILSRPVHSKLKKTFQGLAQKFKDFSGKMEFKDLWRTSSKIHGLFKTVRTLYNL